jgi:hypothetical protein
MTEGNLTIDSSIVETVIEATPAEAVIGYKLLDAGGVTQKTWGGTYGQAPGIPNPLRLPNGDIVHAPSLNTDYSGYMLVEWVMQEPPAPPPAVPASITRRQCALELNAQSLITLQEALDMVRTAAVPKAIAAIFDSLVADGSWTDEQRILAEIDFAADNYYRSNSLLSLMGLTDEQIDQFFIAAKQR